MTQSAIIDISPAQDGGVLKEIRREGPDPDDKPWKGDRVQVKGILSKHLIISIKISMASWNVLKKKINVLSILGALHRYT